jgi:choline-glycine betaine transporter
MLKLLAALLAIALLLLKTFLKPRPKTAVIAVPVALIVLGAVIAILRVVAPKTETDKDDKALAILEKVEDIVEREEE